MRTFAAIAGAMLIGAVVLAGQDGPADGEWPNYGRDPGASRYSPLKQINTTNVTRLQVAWTYDTKAPITTAAPGSEGAADNESPAPASGAVRGRGAGAAAGAAAAPAAAGRGRGVAQFNGPGSRGATSEATPLMVNGVVYLSTTYHRVIALDPDTGKEIWVTDLGVHPPATRGISYWPGDATHPPRLVVATNTAYLLLLDPKTGEMDKSFGKDGLVDLAADLPEKFQSKRIQRAVSSQAAIYGHFAITGNHPGESPSQGASGDIHAYDLRTGAVAWVFHTVPRPGEPNHDAWQGDQWVDRGGANAWGQMTVDDARGILYAPIGSPNTDFYGADRLGSNLYGASLVAIDANTGALKWFFQMTHHDNWDYDPSSAPILFDVTHGGQTIPAVGIYTKQGLFFMFDRVTGKPIYGVEERPVLSDNPVPGDVYSPTQPFPVKPRALARNTFSPDEIAKVTPEHEAFCKGLLTLEGGVMTGGPYAQYGPKPRVIFPGWTGGGNWSGEAWDPATGYVFFPSKDEGMLNKMVRSEAIPDMWVRRGPDGAPPRVGTSFSNPNTGWPCQAPPWNELIAVNANTGDVAWHVPLGSFEALDKLGVPATGTPGLGGPMATAGGLVFIGASDARFRAFDAKTGQVLWTFDLSENGKGSPMSYLGKNGKQYVAIFANGGNSRARTIDQSQLGGRLYVFALPD